MLDVSSILIVISRAPQITAYLYDSNLAKITTYSVVAIRYTTSSSLIKT